jgi:hypothetical protein
MSATRIQNSASAPARQSAEAGSDGSRFTRSLRLKQAAVNLTQKRGIGALIMTIALMFASSGLRPTLPSLVWSTLAALAFLAWARREETDA